LSLYKIFIKEYIRKYKNAWKLIIFLAIAFLVLT